MNILVTAGNTQTPIDKVRCLTNIFTGRTGAAIALEAYGRANNVTLLTSHGEVVRDLAGVPATFAPGRWRVLSYRTFEDLERLLEQQLTTNHFDVVIHCAAVSDHQVSGVFAPAPGAVFNPATNTWHGTGNQAPAMLDRAAGKVKSTDTELWLRLERTPKLIDRMRSAWNFAGVLVKFKLEVGLNDAELLAVAEASRQQSQANWMVANTLEEAAHWAYLGPLPSGYEKVPRRALPARLLDVIEGKV